MLSIDRQIIKGIDWPLVTLALLIPMLGLIVLYSAGYDPDQTRPYFDFLPIAIQSHAFVKQCLFLSAGIIVMIIGASIPTEWLQRIAYPFYWICIFLLLWVELNGVVVNGSQRWIDLGAFNLQPAEPVKLAITLTVAKYLAKHPPPRGGYTFKKLIVPGLILALPMAFILMQPDLGSALSVAGVAGLMIFFLGVRVKTLIIAVIAALIAIVPIWEFGLHPYQKRRVMVLLNPGIDPKGSGWHIIQSTIAVGSGSLFGEGFREGTQTQLEFLPEHTTDFIFSVLAEEWGFFGCTLILSLYLMFFYRILYNAQRARDLLGTLIIVGVGSKFLFHVMVNVGMVLGLLPVVGIPLPLFSYGGSSILSSMFGVGLILGQGIRRRSYP